MKLTLLGVLLVSLALAAGCASDSEGQPSTGTNGAAPPASSADSAKTVSNISEEEAREVAGKILLTLRDFPAGWSQEPPEEEKEDPEFDSPPECQAFFEQEIPPGALVDIDSPEFDGPDTEQVDSGATVYVDAEAAHQAFADARDVYDRCREPLRAAYTKYLGELLREEYPDANVEVTAFAMDWLSFPAYGDESLAMRMSVTMVVGDQTIDAYTDMFGWRVGPIEGDMSFTNCFVPPDLEEEQRLAEIVEKRLREAAEDLD